MKDNLNNEDQFKQIFEIMGGTKPIEEKEANEICDFRLWRPPNHYLLLRSNEIFVSMNCT